MSEWAEGYAVGFEEGADTERGVMAGWDATASEVASALRAEAEGGARGRSLGQHLVAAGVVAGPCGWRECLLAIADLVDRGGASRG